jgi:hypothetical protein
LKSEVTTMSRFTNTLARVRVAAPCKADWDEMRGGDRVRFCHRCSLNVYNLSEMTRREAERLVTRTEGERLCVRFYRRKDGTVLTRPCPVGLRALKRRVSRISSAAFATIVGFISGVALTPKHKEDVPSLTANVVVTEEDLTVKSAPPEFTEAMGSMRMMLDPTGEQYAAGGALGFALFVVGYPLMKLRQRGEARRREALSIWRRP